MLRPLLMVGLLAALAPSSPAQLLEDRFVDVTAVSGMEHHSLAGVDRVGGMGSAVTDWCQTGVALGDLDGDGDPDLVFAGGLLPNTVLRNDGKAGFADMTAQTGMEVNELDRCVAMGDYDNDGDLDVYIGSLRMGTFAVEGRSRLYRNEGSFQFTDVTDLAGVAGRGHSIFAQWFDVDRDGLLDLYVCEFHVTQNAYYRNNGDGTFKHEGSAMSIDWPGSAHASSFLDSDSDGGLDLFVGNDWLVSSIAGLPANFGDCQLSGAPAAFNTPFADVTDTSGMDQKRGIMGLAWGDPDYDGDFDLYKTDVGGNYLLINQGWPSSGQPWVQAEVPYNIVSGTAPWHEFPGTFGVNSSWAALFFSADFDLWDDFFVTNGHVAGMNPGLSHLPRNEPNDFYWGQGPGVPFVKDTVGAGLYSEIDDRGLAAGDLDLDGDLDLIVTATKGAARLYENRIDPDGQGWLQVVPKTHTSAPGGIGTIVRWTDSAGYVHMRALGSDGPTASQHEVLAHFGMGLEPSADVQVEFPSGMTLTYPGVQPNTRLVAVEPKLFELNARVLPVSAFAKPGFDRLVVDVFAHDETGTALDATASVLIDVSGLSPKGPVVSIGGNHFRRQFDLPTGVGSYPVSVSIDGWSPDVVPVARFRAGIHPVGTEVVLHPTAVRAGSADQFKVVIVPKDAAGFTAGPGLPMDVTVPGATPLGNLVDHGDGRYSRRFLAPASPGVRQPQVSLQGATLQTSTYLDVAAAPTERTEVMLLAPVPLQSMSENEIRVCVTPRDAKGRRLGPGAKVELELLVTPDLMVPASFGARQRVNPPTASQTQTGGPVVTVPTVGGSPAAKGGVALRRDLDPSGQEDGEFVFAIARDLDDLSGPSGTVQVLVDGKVVGLVPFSF